MEVVRNGEKSRFEVDLGNAMAFADYIEKSGTIIFTHTEVPPKHEGEGFGSKIVVQALDYARREGLRVIPLCPFFRSYIDSHPDYQDLLEGS